MLHDNLAVVQKHTRESCRHRIPSKIKQTGKTNITTTTEIISYMITLATERVILY